MAGLGSAALSMLLVSTDDTEGASASKLVSSKQCEGMEKERKKRGELGLNKVGEDRVGRNVEMRICHEDWRRKRKENFSRRYKRST